MSYSLNLQERGTEFISLDPNTDFSLSAKDGDSLEFLCPINPTALIIVLIFDSVRFDCNKCKKPFTQVIGDVVPDCTYTHRLYEEMSNPKRKQDASTLAELYGGGYKLAESILLKAGEAKLSHRRKVPITVEHLGIDEISKKRDKEITYLS